MNQDELSADERRMSLWQRLHHGETHVRFIQRWKIWFAVSALVIAVGMAFVGVRGLNLGIDFTGGNVWTVAAHKATVTDVEKAATSAGLKDVKVQETTNTGGGGRQFRIQATTVKGTTAEVKARFDAVDQALSKATGTPVSQVNADTVGPSWGKQISGKARTALIVFLIAISLYITLRFEVKMALATLAALIHDLLVVVGVYAVVGFPVTPATVIAILTILGFSIYDGIVVFDRVDENSRTLTSKSNQTYAEMTNRSLNQVLMRSLNTSVTALLPIMSILFIGAYILGATTLEDFGLALFIGVLSGAYSSLFIASPVLVLLKEREPRYRALKQRLAEKGPVASTPGSSGTKAPAGQAAVAGSSTGGVATATATAAPARPGTYSAAHPPRPRKKGKKR
ncbi:MAG: protein translocase subunit secF [Acidimicrobiales bacterium]|nr:protein translocase subunit secF [Acidimicrobiales bacterium]